MSNSLTRIQGHVFAIAWALLTLLAVIALDKHGVSHKWFNAVFWTGGTYAALIGTNVDKWRRPRFWGLICVSLLPHLCLMWIVYGYMVSTNHLHLLLALAGIWIEVSLIDGWIERQLKHKRTRMNAR